MTCPHNPTDADADLCAECLEEYHRDMAKSYKKGSEDD